MTQQTAPDAQDSQTIYGTNLHQRELNLMITHAVSIQRSLLMMTKCLELRKQMAIQLKTREEMTSLLARGVESAKPRRIRGRNSNHHPGRGVKLKARHHLRKMELGNPVEQTIYPSSYSLHQTKGLHEALCRKRSLRRLNMGL